MLKTACLTLAALAVLAACGSSKSETKTDTTTPPPAETTTPPPADAAPAPDAGM